MALNVMIVDERDNHYEYAVATLAEALDLYIKEALGFNKNFSISEYFWCKIKETAGWGAILVPDDMVRLVNGFCKRDAYKIKKLLTGYTLDYPICLTFAPSNVYKVFADSQEVKTNSVAVHYGTDKTLRVAANKGYVISNAQILDPAGGFYDDALYRPILQQVMVSNIEKQLILEVVTDKIVGDWQINHIAENIDSVGEVRFTPADSKYQLMPNPNEVFQQEDIKSSICTVTNGNGYSCTLSTPYGTQEIPEVRIYRDGIKIYEYTYTKGKEHANDSLYSFDRIRWQGVINLAPTDLTGHICIVASVVTYKGGPYTVTLTEASAQDVALKPAYGGTTSVNLTNIQHSSTWQAQVVPPDNYVIDNDGNGVTVTMGGIDITSACYEPLTGIITISSVTGDIEITAITRKR